MSRVLVMSAEEMEKVMQERADRYKKQAEVMHTEAAPLRLHGATEEEQAVSKKLEYGAQAYEWLAARAQENIDILRKRRDD